MSALQDCVIIIIIIIKKVLKYLKYVLWCWREIIDISVINKNIIIHKSNLQFYKISFKLTLTMDLF